VDRQAHTPAVLARVLLVFADFELHTKTLPPSATQLKSARSGRLRMKEVMQCIRLPSIHRKLLLYSHM
jgi:hypothetical protein